MITIIDRVKTCISDATGIERHVINDDSTFKSLTIDSLDVVEIMMFIEDEFNIVIPDKVAEQLNSVDKLSCYVSKILSCNDQNQSSHQTSPDDVPINHGKHWTSEDDDLVVIMFAGRSSIDIISKVLGRSHHSILHRLSDKKLIRYNHEENAYYTVPTLIYKA